MNQCKLLPAPGSKWTDDLGVEWDNKNAIILSGMRDSLDALSTPQVNHLVGPVAPVMTLSICLLSSSLSILYPPPLPSSPSALWSYDYFFFYCILSNRSSLLCLGPQLQKFLQISQLLNLTDKCLLPIQLSQEVLLFSKLVWAPGSLSTAQRCLHKYLLVGKSHSSLLRDDEGRGPKYKTMVQETVLPFDRKSLPKHFAGTCIQSNLWKVKLDQIAQKTGGWLPNRNKSGEVGSSCKLNCSQGKTILCLAKGLKTGLEINPTKQTLLNVLPSNPVNEAGNRNANKAI